MAIDTTSKDVAVTSSALPSGAATSAKQDTLQTAVDAIKVAVEILDNTVAGAETQVDVITLPALPTGTNNIGDIDVLTVPAPLNVTGAGTEIAALRVTLANDSTGLVSVDDNGGSLTVDAPVATPVFVRLSDGAAAIATLPVSAASLPLPSGASTLAEQQTQTTALQLIDDAVYTDGVGTPSKAIGIAGTDGTNPQIVKTDAAGELQVDVLTMPTTTVTATDLDVRNLVATQDAVVVKADVSALHDGLTALTPKFVIIDAATSGDNTILAAVATKKIRVVALFLVSAGTVNVRFESGAAGTALTGQMNLIANTGFVLPFNPVGWFETAANTLLNLELSAAISVDGCLTYVEV